jgi:hypothetical protein
MHDSTSSPSRSTQTIDPTFRNGSITAVGIILGFSLGLLSQWASNPIDLRLLDTVVAVPIVSGIVLQGKALVDLLSIASLAVVNYDRAKQIFLAGLALVAFGIAAAVMLDILGFETHTLALTKAS